MLVGAEQALAHFGVKAYELHGKKNLVIIKSKIVKVSLRRRGEKMKNISDIIEGYLKAIIEEESKGQIEIKRSEIAEKFQCVPSQINYVINTRFTQDRGYLVESKRGGGGYIRILRVRAHTKADLIEHIINSIENGASESVTEDIVFRLLEEEVITNREAKLLLAALSRNTLNIPLPTRDKIRARLLTAMLLTLKYEKND